MIDTEKIIKIVLKYANKHSKYWGIDEYVHQDDEAQIDAIDLFGEIIGALPEAEMEDEE